MTSPDNAYREFAARTHRTLASYLTLYAWTHNLDCIVLERSSILSFWNIAKRVEKSRLTWFRQDVGVYFQQIQILYRNAGTKKFSSIFLARRPYPVGAFKASLNSTARATQLTKDNFRTAVVALPTETQMMTQLTNIIHGLAERPFPDVVGPPIEPVTKRIVKSLLD